MIRVHFKSARLVFKHIHVSSIQLNKTNIKYKVLSLKLVVAENTSISVLILEFVVGIMVFAILSV